MKLKKTLITTSLGLSILSFGVTTNASAEEINTEDNPAIVDSNSIQDTKKSENVFLKDFKAAPNNASTVTTYAPLFSDPYAVAKSNSTVSEDYIYAKARAFNSNGSLISTNSNSANKSTFVSATAKNSSIYYGGHYAIGNHTYKLSGYSDVNHETKAYW
ncbi:XoxI protein (plasmid) [Bacillus mycoides]|uniref:XoxI protein n=1 Tax=Bacillus mycoides TaxID=1405 RepID=UPI001C013C6D|nr:XoxI protein [Bacillus mycoides]QWH64201.1 XoxI protein [Bacillus mycoides]